MLKLQRISLESRQSICLNRDYSNLQMKSFNNTLTCLPDGPILETLSSNKLVTIPAFSSITPDLQRQWTLELMQATFQSNYKTLQKISMMSSQHKKRLADKRAMPNRSKLKLILLLSNTHKAKIRMDKFNLRDEGELQDKSKRDSQNKLRVHLAKIQLVLMIKSKSHLSLIIIWMSLNLTIVKCKIFQCAKKRKIRMKSDKKLAPL